MSKYLYRLTDYSSGEFKSCVVSWGYVMRLNAAEGLFLVHVCVKSDLSSDSVCKCCLSAGLLKTKISVG